MQNNFDTVQFSLILGNKRLNWRVPMAVGLLNLRQEAWKYRESPVNTQQQQRPENCQ